MRKDRKAESSKNEGPLKWSKLCCLPFALIVLASACANPAPKSQPAIMTDKDKQQLEAQARIPGGLIKQCRGVIHNCICLDDGGATMLGTDGALHPIDTGRWVKTTCGTLVFFPNNDHSQP